MRRILCMFNKHSYKPQENYEFTVFGMYKSYYEECSFCKKVQNMRLYNVRTGSYL